MKAKESGMNKKGKGVWVVLALLCLVGSKHSLNP
jgi:hypothetical protein